MNPVEKLIASKERKNIIVAGDCLNDVWIHGIPVPSQDGCNKFIGTTAIERPGGAANAQRQLKNWDDHTFLFGFFFEDKIRFVNEAGRIVFRHDHRVERDEKAIAIDRDALLKKLPTADAVLLSDYDKGFLDAAFVRQIIDACNERGIPIVADAKREPSFYSGAILKGNADYAARWMGDLASHSPMAVLTMGAEPPVLMGEQFNGIQIELSPKPAPVHCKSHVGAGDCFSAHLTLCLAHGIPLEEAVKIAHAAGRVYVQFEHGRPPFPFEIRRDLDPVGGKILCSASALRQSNAGRIVILTNGVFRMGAHAGHACLMQWARQQGDCLVVAVNDDESASALRHGQTILPFAERATTLAAMSAVDWVVPFNGNASYLAKQLQPDVLVKGFDYRDANIPGSEVVKDVRIMPESPYPRHTSNNANL